MSSDVGRILNPKSSFISFIPLDKTTLTHAIRRCNSLARLIPLRIRLFPHPIDTSRIVIKGLGILLHPVAAYRELNSY